MHRIRFSAVTAILVLILACASLSAAATARKGTIITKSGEKFESVNYVIDNARKHVTITVAGRQKNIGFTNIEAILDGQGVNIAPDLLKSHYSPTLRSFAGQPLREQPADDNVRRKLWKVALGLGATFSIPSGPYYDRVKSGIGFGGTVRMPISNSIAIRLDISRAGFGYPNSLAVIDHSTGYVGAAQIDLTTVRYTLAAQLCEPMNRDKRNLNMYYVFGGLGMTDHLRRGTVTLYDESGTPHTQAARSRNTSLTAVFGGGVIIMFGEKFGADLGAEWHVVFLAKGLPPYHEFLAVNFEYAHNIDVRFGITTFFR